MSRYTNQKDITSMTFLEKCALPIETLEGYWWGKSLDLKHFFARAERKGIYTIGDLIELTEEKAGEFGNFRTKMMVIQAVEALGLRFGSRLAIEQARKSQGIDRITV